MTNFEKIKNSTPDEVAEMVLLKATELDFNYSDSKLDVFKIQELKELDFAKWLNSEFNSSEIEKLYEIWEAVYL